MLRTPATDLDLAQPRTVGQILRTALWLYARVPVLFILLAGIVVVPYEVLIVVVAHGRSVKVGTGLLFALIDLALVDPFISALEVQALLDLGAGNRVSIPSVIRRGLVVLPVVAAAEIVAGLCEAAGFLLFVIPGLLVAVRWAVVAQTAAAERTNWPSAIRRSIELTRGNFWRVFGLLVITVVLNDLVASIIGSGESTTAAVIGVVLAVLAHSFGTLLISLLYFDLRAREAAPVA